MIQTRRLLLRAPKESDLQPLHGILSDPRAMRYWSRPEHTDISETKEFLAFCMQDASESHLEYMIERDGDLIGRIAMWKIAEVGFILHPDFWGQGYVTEALRAMLPEVFTRYPQVTTVTAELDPRNLGCARLLEKCGFVQTGYEEKNFDYGGIEWTDTAYYELRRADFETSQMAASYEKPTAS
ncbi:MAG: GNAT family N-acetyltransferase [Pelagimonas sp.]|jgi:RimJ/RimL family protein N-acetyltransferase|nr:GNAT family N-acetyltransferase [Pelagimonas sp.]